MLVVAVSGVSGSNQMQSPARVESSLLITEAGMPSIFLTWMVVK